MSFSEICYHGNRLYDRDGAVWRVQHWYFHLDVYEISRDGFSSATRTVTGQELHAAWRVGFVPR